MMFFGHDTVDVLVAPVVAGPYNSTVADWPNATATATPAEVRPNRSTEVDRSSATVVWNEAYLPPAVDLSQALVVGGRAVRIRWRGVDHDLDGVPAVFTARGAAHHQRVVLKATV